MKAFEIKRSLVLSKFSSVEVFQRGKYSIVRVGVYLNRAS